MSLLRLATRNLLSRPVTPPPPRIQGSGLPTASKPQAKDLRHADGFTPAPTRRPGEAKKPELTPAPPRARVTATPSAPTRCPRPTRAPASSR
ncbi:hypothetical protein EJ065_3040 [Corallococcus coralloides]|uniref:Uncharacterized protein n=1 Tax=Corallococcus coralloides TaxID=184914 RepID=A0A410RRR9_CORCK|nr:hypothetical protein EJ065_3040 [Corallococcus coralloides]